MRNIFLVGLIFFFNNTYAQNTSLPDCPGSWNSHSWSNCFGVQVTPEGKKYISEFKDEAPHGSGRVYESDGSFYKGNLVRGRKQGKGEISYLSGDRYTGDFFDDKLDGEGVYHIFLSKARYEGSLKENLFEGTGTMYYADGGKYVGQWKADQKHGKGIEYNALGRVEFNGIYENGERQ
jgi:hypothetical protein